MGEGAGREALQELAQIAAAGTVRELGWTMV